MHLVAQAFWLPKEGNSWEEYEDAYWPERQVDQKADAFSFAVADGATETSFSGVWAKILVRAYCRGQLSERKLSKSLPRLQSAWLKRVSGKPLPWYAEEKLRSGAFSSLLGLTVKFFPGEGRAAEWQAIAIGDSCLFQVRGHNLITAFPLTHFEQFNSRPYLLSSNPTYNSYLARNIVRAVGSWETDDAFYLMTDALACWFLKTIECGEKPWEIVRDLATSDQIAPFAEWITELRKVGAIRNDDVTLLRVNMT